jgi:hypothetical protein
MWGWRPRVDIAERLRLLDGGCTAIRIDHDHLGGTMRGTLRWRVKLVVLLSAALPWFAGADIANAADKFPSVFFWHVVLVLDHSSYQALKESPQIAALAGTEFRHTQTNNNSYSGFYLYGRQTFMEIFEESAEYHLYACDLGLIVEQEGGLSAVAQSLRKQFGEDFKIENTVANWGNRALVQGGFVRHDR